MTPAAPDPAKKQAAQAALAQLRANFLANLPETWQELRLAVAASSGAVDDLDWRRLALQHAHRLRGTAGALELYELTETAAGVEDTLELIYAASQERRPALWAELERLLDEGSSAIAADRFGRPPGAS